MVAEGFRHNNEPVYLSEMFAHEGRCHYCEPGTGIVKMLRENVPPFRLRPNYCFCIYCGQRYFMKIDDLDRWDREQWRQKAQSRGCVRPI